MKLDKTPIARPVRSEWFGVSAIPMPSPLRERQRVREEGDAAGRRRRREAGSGEAKPELRGLGRLPLSPSPYLHVAERSSDQPGRYHGARPQKIECPATG
jgi:hypothetical protein